jgi:hypothetical protein
MTCPASITKANGRVRPSSVYAREGTAAHKIAEMVAGGDMFPPGRLTVEGQEFITGRAMLLHLRPYIEALESYRALGFAVHTEVKVGLKGSGGTVWGTSDCVAIGARIVAILDLKYGKGVQVSPDTAQLRIYGLSAIDTFGCSAETVMLTIHQPRIDPVPRSFSLSRDELEDWRKQELNPALERLVKGDPTEVAGPWCRWCVRRDECAGYANRRSGMAADVFNDGLA